MTKQLFVETIEAIKKQAEHDHATATSLSHAFPNAFEASLLPDNHFITEQLIKLLRIETGDEPKENSWIEYFIYDLGFGSEYYDGCAKYCGLPMDGINIDISTAEKLYDFLMWDQSKKETA